MSKVTPKIKWKKKLRKEKIKTSIGYLDLLFNKSDLKKILKQLCEERSDLRFYQAKDLLRASGLNCLTPTDKKVGEKMEMILGGKSLDPAIIIGIDNRLFIADGYHRISACYNLGQSTKVKCRHIVI